MKKKHQMRSSALAASCLLALTLSSSAITVLTTNGDFETGDSSSWNYFPSASSTFNVTGDSHTGSFAGVLANTAQASAALIKQENLGIGVLSPGQEITITFWAKGSAAVGGVHFAEFFGSTGGNILGGAPLFPTSDYTKYEFTRIAGADVATNGVTLQIGAITGADIGSSSTLFIDNVSVSVVPEPSSLILGASGLALLIGRRRRS